MAVSVSEKSGILWLTLLRPPSNAVDLELVRALNTAVSAADTSRPFILTGRGRYFSTGIDTAVFGDYSPAERQEMVLGMTQILKRLVCHPAPVISALNGDALGAGFVLALAADYRIAGCLPDTRFGLTEIASGLPFPAGSSEVIRQEVPAPLLRDLALTSRIISRDELCDAGLIDQACQPENLIMTAARMAKRLGAQQNFAAIKAQVRQPLRARLEALAASGEDPLLAAFGAG